MFKIPLKTRSLLRKALHEDIGRGDLTTEALIPSRLAGRASIKAKESGVLCGGPVVKEVFRLIDPELKIQQKVSEGSRVLKGKKLFLLRGRMASILKGERIALNFLGRLCGVATLTREFVRRVERTGAKIYDTRKTTPLWRDLEKYAVRCGGGQNHRFGLWDEILVKDNHWLAIRKLLDETHCRYFGDRLRLKLRRREVPVELEVANLRELGHVLDGNLIPDRILLDHFSLSELSRAVRMVKGRHAKTVLEASGGIRLGTVRQVAKTGVRRISVGALTHSAPALDVSLCVEAMR